MPQTNVRVVGSGFTTLLYAGKPIAYLQSFTDSGQTPAAGQGYEAIYTLNQQHHAVEIATSRVLGLGTITASITELWEQNVWEALGRDSAHSLVGLHDIVDVWKKLSRVQQSVTVERVVKTPKAGWRGKSYQNCLIVGIDDGETVNINQLSVAKNIQIAYTHSMSLTSPGSGNLDAGGYILEGGGTFAR